MNSPLTSMNLMNFRGFSINSFHLFFCLTLDTSQYLPKRKMSEIRTEMFFLPSLFHWRWETLNYQLWFICENNCLSPPGCLNHHISPAVTPFLAPPKHPKEFLLSTYMDIILPVLTYHKVILWIPQTFPVLHTGCWNNGNLSFGITKQSDLDPWDGYSFFWHGWCVL